MTSLAQSDTSALVRCRIRVWGVVQGVGFRPFVHRLAAELGLAGHVGNDTEGVFVEVEGAAARIGQFEARLSADAPPLARIFGIESERVAVLHEHGFRIVESHAESSVRTFVSPDVAVCDDCLAEMFDPGDRRSRYPFINCTNCGPRFTITLRLPYDRPNTTMREFDLCADCSAEYHDPADRRFHAQPLACADCGPRIWFEDPGGTVEGTDAAIAATQASLARGEIVAIKGLGGYHLACDATSPDGHRHVAAAETTDGQAPGGHGAQPGRGAHPGPPRSGRGRCSWPVPSVRSCWWVGVRALCSNEQVAPHNPHIGLLLPYTPLHHLLFRDVPGMHAPVPTMVVMTSGNLTDEPICYDDADARARLGRIADSWLIHDRPIHVPCDDSVLRIADGEELPIRRSRGYAPLPVQMPFELTPTLATGGELKNTFCLASGRHAWVSQHIGDMGSLETLAAFERSIGQFGEMYQVAAQGVVADAHPGYQSRRWADDRSGRPVELVQHHHAHIASVMAEHAVEAGERVIGFAFDGTGYGSDGAIWGGEVLIAGYDGFERRAHLRYVPLPGGDAAVRRALSRRAGPPVGGRHGVDA